MNRLNLPDVDAALVVTDHQSLIRLDSEPPSGWVGERVAIRADDAEPEMGSGTITGALPVVEFEHPSPRASPPDKCYDLHGDRLTYWWDHDGGFRDVSDQLPFLDGLKPGDWVVTIGDVFPTTEMCPACQSYGGRPCKTCDSRGTCPPIPYPGWPCGTCHGYGAYRKMCMPSEAHPHGWAVLACPTCNGSGRGDTIGTWEPA